MRIPVRREMLKVLLVLGAAALGGLPARAAVDDSSATQEGQPAVWTPKKLHFLYQGFTTTYSCDGLEDKIRIALLQLGARQKDLKVTPSGCASPYGRPDPFPGVDVKMFVLEPASGKAAQSGQRTVPAHWQPVDLKLTQVGDYNPSGECELMEQIKSRILPLFATRAIESKSDCIPYQATAGSPVLRLQVLAPDKATERAKDDAGQDGAAH